jgi:hypothetical protein
MNSKNLFVTLLCAGAMAALWFVPNTSTGQTEAEDSPLTSSLLEVQAQQKQLTDNQAAIDTKLAAIQEQLRIARIYVSRSGGKK